MFLVEFTRQESYVRFHPCLEQIRQILAQLNRMVKLRDEMMAANGNGNV